MILKNFFLSLSQNQSLNQIAQNYGLTLGAKNIVAGTTIDEMITHVKILNKNGLAVTIDRLGEFVTDKKVALAFKDEILEVLEAIHTNQLNAHISVKLTQLGLGIDKNLCLESMREIANLANNFSIFINMDMEDYSSVKSTFEILDKLKEEYNNVGTVIQAYLHRAEDDVEQYKNTRMRIVKGAYKERENVAIQDKVDIDRNYINLIEHHLLHGTFTSIATHDHRIINEVIKFTNKHHISKENYEFQMLYGFRKDYQLELVKQGYNVCTYVPFGNDWYGYFMRRLAERPQNINLVVKEVLNKKTKIVLGVAGGLVVLNQLRKKSRVSK